VYQRRQFLELFQMLLMLLSLPREVSTQRLVRAALAAMTAEVF
jgi:hypothetical protein